MAGSHRRIKFGDLMGFRDQRAQEREDALAKMHAIADESGMDL
jgi:hypothetical protein